MYVNNTWSGWVRSINEYELNAEGTREVLLSGNAPGGEDIQVTLVNKVSNYRNLLFVLYTGNVYLDTKVNDKNLFCSGIRQRVHWYDISNLYYTDFSYINETTVRIQTFYPDTANLGYAIIGYN